MPHLSPRTGAGALLGVAAAIFVVGYTVNGIDDRQDVRTHAAAATGGGPWRGEAMFIQYGCGSWHRMARVRKATGMIGPPLDGIAVRAMIAGKLENSPDNLRQWIRDPQAVSPGTAMPDLGVGDRDARDITA